ncbi:MAG: hypothetical protein Kow0080_12370 [Candidatus Promineifilaceae bacterium]
MGTAVAVPVAGVAGGAGVGETAVFPTQPTTPTIAINKKMARDQARTIQLKTDISVSEASPY